MKVNRPQSIGRGGVDKNRMKLGNPVKPQTDSVGHRQTSRFYSDMSET